MRLARSSSASLAVLIFFLAGFASASLGDRLPEFRNCLLTCHEANCEASRATHIPLLHRLFLWDCPSECDYVCQHIVTAERVFRSTTLHHELHDPVVQFHGKWPFYRFLGMQEPFSVLFSLLNLGAHVWGLQYIRERIPASYGLRRWYEAFGYVGYLAWTASAVFHTRDSSATEKLDYFAAGGYVLFGLYMAPVRIFRLDDAGRSPTKASLVRVWTALCVLLYAAHVAYLSLWRWDYGYNMAANIAVGLLQNVLWIAFSFYNYRRSSSGGLGAGRPPGSRSSSGVRLSKHDKAASQQQQQRRQGQQPSLQLWTAWPGMIVLCISVAMSLELLEFVPLRLMLDAHSLWHLGTVGPTVWWYLFLVKDAREDMAAERLRA